MKMQPKQSVKPVICQVLHSMAVGGAEILARQFALGAREEFDSIFVCLDQLGSLGEQIRKEGFFVQVLERKAGLDLGVAKQLATICRERKVDVLHAHQYTPFFYSAISRWRAMRPTPPVLFTEHGRTFPDFRRPKRVLANRFLLRQHDRVVAVGNQVKHALVTNEGIPEGRVEVIYNGIDIQTFSRDDTARLKVRASLGLGDDDIAVMQVARLNHMKDHITAIKAWQRLQSHPSIRLFFIGEGEERAAIESFVTESGLECSITLLGTRTDVAQLLNAADVFLMTSVSEGIPLTLIEAMANRLPCVSTNVGGIAEVVVNEETGLLTSAGDDQAIAESVIRMAMNPAQREQFGVAGRQRALRIFSDGAMHDSYHRLYREMAGLNVVNE